MPPDTALFALACLVSIAGLAPALIAFVRTFHRPRGVQSDAHPHTPGAYAGAPRV